MENANVSVEENASVDNDLNTATIHHALEDSLEEVKSKLYTLNICSTLIKKDGERKVPEFAHDTDVGLDMYPCTVTLESYSGHEYRFDITEDEKETLILIKKTEEEEMSKTNLFKRIVNFFTGKEWRMGWKRLKFDTGIAVEPDSFYFYFGAPNSRVVKTDVFLQNSMGIIDPTYRGTIRFFYRNLENGFIRDTVTSLCKCCGQIFPSIRVKPLIKFVDKLSDTERGTGGFGSSSK